MAKVGLSQIVTPSFLRSFTALSSQGKSGTAALQGSSASVDLSSGLRLGAQAYARAVQGLNSGIVFVNTTRNTLEQLGEVVDDMISLSERAAKAGSGKDKRRQIDFAFSELIDKFQEIVDEAKLANKEVLDVNNIAEVLTNLGLDKETSDSIGAIFKEFSLTGTEDTLISEETKGKPPVPIPRSAYIEGKKSEYTLEQISNAAAQNGAVATGFSVYQSDNGSGLQTIKIYNGTTTSTLAVTLDATLKAVNEITGHSVIESSEDFLGFNGDLTPELFLVDTSGAVIHQFTTDPGVSFGEVDITEDNLTVLYSRDSSGFPTVQRRVAGSIGQDPALAASTLIHLELGGATISNVRISNDGSHLGYFQDSGATHTTNFKDANTLIASPSLPFASDRTHFEFLGSNKVAFLIGSSATKTMKEYTYGDSDYGITLVEDTTITNFDAVERQGNGTAYVIYQDGDNDKIVLKDENALTVNEYSLGMSDIPSKLSLAFDAEGTIEAGYFGVMPSITTDSDSELYRLNGEKVPRYTSRISNYQSIFDTAPLLLKRPDAYRAMHDLKAIRDQIDDNISTLDDLTETIANNLELARAAGFAFLDLSNQIDPGDEEAIARNLQQLIRKAPAAALAQAENLQPMAVAALIAEDESS